MSVENMVNLKRKQQAENTRTRMLSVIEKYIAEHGWAPSVREIGELVGLDSPSTTHNHLTKLSIEGKIVYKGVRQIRIVKKG